MRCLRSVGYGTVGLAAIMVVATGGGGGGRWRHVSWRECVNMHKYLFKLCEPSRRVRNSETDVNVFAVLPHVSNFLTSFSIIWSVIAFSSILFLILHFFAFIQAQKWFIFYDVIFGPNFIWRIPKIFLSLNLLSAKQQTKADSCWISLQSSPNRSVCREACAFKVMSISAHKTYTTRSIYAQCAGTHKIKLATRLDSVTELEAECLSY